MEWSTVAIFAIAVVLVLGLLYLGAAMYAAKKGAESMRKMQEDFDKTRKHPWR